MGENMEIQKKAYRINEFCAAHGIGRSKFYEEVAEGRIEIVKLGRLTLITDEAAKNWLKRCQAEYEERSCN